MKSRSRERGELKKNQMKNIKNDDEKKHSYKKPIKIFETNDKLDRHTKESKKINLTFL